MTYSTLQAELERLFELDEMLNLSRDLMGLAPGIVGGETATGSFAAALTRYCADSDALEALCDAMLATKPGASPKLLAVAQGRANLVSEPELGSSLGGYVLKKKLGHSTAADTYLATEGSSSFRVKVLRSSATRDRAGLNRLLTLNRLIASLHEPGLPRIVAIEKLDDRFCIVQRSVEGLTLAERLANGPLNLGEALAVIRAIAFPLASLHERQICHGNLKPENILLFGDTPTPSALLLDAGLDRLIGFGHYVNGTVEDRGYSHSLSTTAPEQIRGIASDIRSDVYALGAIFYQILVGEPVFSGPTAFEALLGHLEKAPPAPSAKAKAISVASHVDQFILRLLSKRPEDRPRSASEVLATVDELDRARSRRSIITEDQMAERIEALIAAPESRDAALALESTLDDGADAARIAEAFTLAAEGLLTSEDKESREAAKSLLYRVARLFEHAAKEPDRAEQVYQKILALDPHDDGAQTALSELQRRLGKYDEALESLLGRVENADSPGARARLLSEMAQIYRDELHDVEQAIFAYTQAFCEAPSEARYADHIEELAGDDARLYNESLSAIAAAVGELSVDADARGLLLSRAGFWYLDKVKADDHALGCFQNAVAINPANLKALSGMARIYRRAKQWPELTLVLSRSADAASTPSERRNLRAECAQVHEVQLNDTALARTLYEEVVSEDPAHAVASPALVRLTEGSKDYKRLAELLTEQARSQPTEAKLRTLLRLGEVYEEQLSSDELAIERFREVLQLEAGNGDALRGLDRIFSRAGRYHELLENLKTQLSNAATPRQKIGLLERLAAIYDEEFLNHAEAAETWEQVLSIDETHEEAFIALGRHYRVLERWEDVAAIYERQIGLTSISGRRIEQLLALGRMLNEELHSGVRASEAFERVLTLDPTNQTALEALARLRETSGDADAALQAVLALADKATVPKARAEQLLRAAKLMETRHELDTQILYLEQALEAASDFTPASDLLASAYLKRGDIHAVLTLLNRQIDHRVLDQDKGDICGEMAWLSYFHLKNTAEAERLAHKAIGFQKDSIRGQAVLGHLAFDAERFLEATNFYRPIASRADRLPRSEAVTILTRYVNALGRTNATEEAAPIIDNLRRMAPDDSTVLNQIAQIAAEHGSAKKAIELYQDLLERFQSELNEEALGKAYLFYGLSLGREGRAQQAVASFAKAADLDFANVKVLDAWGQSLEQLEDWEEAIRIRSRQLDLLSGDARTDLLTHIGDIVAKNLGDRPRATGLLVAALEERPDDRRLLTKLMQLYSEEKDWGKLVDVVIRLASFVDDAKQKAKYLQTAAIVLHKELNDSERALELYEQVVALDPELHRSEQEALAICRAKGDFAKIERLLRRRLKTQSDDHAAMLATLLELGELYQQSLKDVSKAIDAYEAARTLAPDNRDLLLTLSDLYATDLDKYFQKARECHAQILMDEPLRQESYKALCRLYTRAKHPDATWCLCQALTVLNFADADEERFFARMKGESAIAAQRALGDPDWLDLMHPKADPLLTALFALIEPAIVARRGSEFGSLGYDATHVLDLATHPASLSQNLLYAASVLGMAPPPTFENPEEPGGMLFLHARQPAIVLGSAALAAELPAQPAAFISARHLCFFRPGLYVRQLVPTGTGLKAWLFAAIRLIAPKFPVAADLEGAVNEAQTALDTGLRGPARDQLTRVVNKLLQSGGSLDLKNWVAGVDLTADRIGFLLADDLQSCTEIIRASDESVSSVTATDRYRELMMFAVSDLYLKTRFDLGVALEP